MAITFDTTVGGSTSNSYVTVAEFNAFLDKKPFLSDNDKPSPNNNTLIKKLLISATEFIDNEIFHGSPTTMDTQALEWPRIGVNDRRGYSIDENTLPEKLKEATSELALFLFQEKINNNYKDGFNEEDSVTVNGEVSITFTRDNTRVLLPKSVEAKLMQIGNAWVKKRPGVCR